MDRYTIIRRIKYWLCVPLVLGMVAFSISLAMDVVIQDSREFPLPAFLLVFSICIWFIGAFIEWFLAFLYRKDLL